MQLDYNDQKLLRQAVKADNNKYLKDKKLALTYDYDAIGSDYKEVIVAEHKNNIKPLSTAEIGKQVEIRLKALRPRDFCLRQILKMCYYL